MAEVFSECRDRCDLTLSRRDLTVPRIRRNRPRNSLAGMLGHSGGVIVFRGEGPLKWVCAGILVFADDATENVTLISIFLFLILNIVCGLGILVVSDSGCSLAGPWRIIFTCVEGTRTRLIRSWWKRYEFPLRQLQSDSTILWGAAEV
jgi:hypothetical protein